jgi:hypothetical protein
MILTGETEVLGEKPVPICPNATLPTTNPTWTGLVSNPDLRSEKPATSCLKITLNYV